MKRKYGRLAGAGLAVAAGAVAMAVLGGSPALASPLVCGGGYGPTAEAALSGALDDATINASSIGLYGACTIVGEPYVAQASKPDWGVYWVAQITAECLP